LFASKNKKMLASKLKILHTKRVGKKGYAVAITILKQNFYIKTGTNPFHASRLTCRYQARYILLHDLVISICEHGSKQITRPEVNCMFPL